MAANLLGPDYRGFFLNLIFIFFLRDSFSIPFKVIIVLFYNKSFSTLIY